jgi:hypothetical protein
MEDAKKILSGSSIYPQDISRFKKERYLRSMSEDQFRDEVVRPLFLRKGLKDGRDYCGVHEEGKDCVFVTEDRLGFKVVYAVQTKKGNMNLSKNASSSVIEARTQLLTALQTPIVITKTKEKLYPTYAILCLSGKINSAARNFIIQETGKTHVRFIDLDDLIPDLDEYFPEIWLGIDSDKFPYLRKLKETLAHPLEEYALSDILPRESGYSAVADDMFVKLFLYRATFKMVKRRGILTREPTFEQFPVTSLLNRKEKLLLVLGEAGSGKSTSMRRLAYEIADKGLATGENIIIPIILRATDLAKDNSSIFDICNSTTSELSFENKSCFTVGDLRNGNIALFIDALDEVPNNEKRKDILGRILDLAELYPRCKIVLTSRDYAFIEELDELQGFAKFRLSPIDWKQAASIIRNLHHGKKLKKETLQEYLRRLQDVHGIELNPLLVTVFVATSDYARKDIPANITELFKKYTEMMLGRWDSTKGISQQYLAPLKDFLLSKLAFEMHRRRVTEISRAESGLIFTKELEIRGRRADIPQLIEETIHRSGLFRFIGDSIEFRHLLLQEFFAGRGIPSSDFLETVISDPWWQRAVLFYFGENPSDQRSLERVTSNLSLRTAEEIFYASIAIGLGLQACYLVTTDAKIHIFKWVIDGLSNARRFFLAEEDKIAAKYPLIRFLTYYIFGRDAVACDVLNDSYQIILSEFVQEDLLSEDKEFRQFWTIAGLIECGCLEEAIEEIKKFKPKDDRLLLAIHLGCYLISKLRIFEIEKKKLAKKICDSLESKVSHLRKKVINEWKSEILEVQKDKIATIEDSHVSEVHDDGA